MRPYWRFFALALVPLLANWPAVSGWLTVDPIYMMSGLGMDATPGPLAGLPALDPNIGITTQALGRFAATEWLAGRIPWWNPFDGIGLPLAAEGQNQALFLPFVLLLALRNGPLLILLALQEVAAFSSYALLRQLALMPVAAWIGAALFALNGTFAWFGHGPIMPIAFAPLLLVGIEIEWQAPRRRPGGGSAHGPQLVAVALAFSLYAGFPETAYIDGLLAGAWTSVRAVMCARGDRARFLLRIGSAAVVGLLLAAPFIVPFVHLMTVGDVGAHRLGVPPAAAPPASLPLLVMPYLLGPLATFGSGDPSGILPWIWNFPGGYLPLPVALLSVIGAAAARAPDRALRWFLAAWCLVMIAAGFGLPGLARAVQAIPLLARTQVFRYAAPSWELAATILAAMAIDDWRRGNLQARRIGFAITLGFAAVVIALCAAEAPMAWLQASAPAYDIWLIASVGSAVAIGLATAAQLTLPPRPAWSILLAGLLVGNGIALFSVPRLAGFRHATVDTQAVTYLKQHAGLDRVYALGPLRPNYPAFFRVASLNSDSLPTPRNWARHVATDLDPLSDPNAFTGAFRFPGTPLPDHVAAFRAGLPAYRALGVRYVLVPAGQDLLRTVRTPVSAEGAEPVRLSPGEHLEATISGAALDAGVIGSVAVIIGTYRGASDGQLSVTACAGDRCQGGTGDLASAGDNLPLEIGLDAPLPIHAGEDLRLRFGHDGGTEPVAIWSYPQSAGLARGPGLVVTYQTADLPLAHVYSDRVLDIYEMADPAPYFETVGGPCRISAARREAVTTDCAAPARLIRRELFFDGWSATIDRRPVAIMPEGRLLQAVDVPAGTARIRFRYAPPFARASAAAFALGLVLLVAGLRPGPRQGSALDLPGGWGPLDPATR